MISNSKQISRGVRGLLALTLLSASMLLVGCGSSEPKEVPAEEKEEMRQQLQEMSNREQSGK